MKYIYGVLCHQITNPLRFTLKKLNAEKDTLVLVHVDNKSNIEDFLLEFSNLEHIHFMSERYDIQWGAISQVYATLALLREANKHSYSYFSLLSGDDVPIQPIHRFHQFLLSNSYEYIDLEAQPDHRLENRVKYKYSAPFFIKHPTPLEKLKKKWYKKTFSLGFNKIDISHLPQLYKGSQWFTLSQHAIKYIFQYLENNPKYLSTFNTSLCGDELFFHTILFNSTLKEAIKSKNQKSESYIRFIDWFSGPDFPRTLGEEDFLRMKESNLFFARKLHKDIPLEKLEYFYICHTL